MHHANVSDLVFCVVKAALGVVGEVVLRGHELPSRPKDNVDVAKLNVYALGK